MKTRLVRQFRKIADKEAPNTFEKSLLRAYLGYKGLKQYLDSVENDDISKMYVRSRHFRRRAMGKRLNFITVEDAVIWTSEWLKSFPSQYDMIVGIPRSGLLVANMIALKLGKPLTTPDHFARGKYWLSVHVHQGIDMGKRLKVLLVDDSINSGATMQESIQAMRAAGMSMDVTKAALIVSNEKKPLVDLYYRYVRHPRVFEWNMLHRRIASYHEQGKIAVDMDGVLCENCPPHVDLVESEYRNWIRTAKPYLIPSFEINAIVSGRLEKYREDTVKWLADHNVRYNELVLWQIESKNQRNDGFAKHKIEALYRIKPTLFWESNFNQADLIWKKTKIPVLCTDNWVMFS